MGNNNTRLYYIDFLKAIGLTGIIIAHVSSPNWLLMIRSFDVPLMVILSALLARNSYKKYENEKKGYLKYCLSRFKRLVVPVWLFLTLYFVLSMVVSGKISNPRYYLDSYLLTRYGFGYVWIILIYLYGALLVPLFSKLSRPIMILPLLILYIVYEIMCFYQIGMDNRIIETTFYYIIPYGLLTCYGYYFEKMSNKTKVMIMILSGVFFMLMALYYLISTGSFQLVQIAKYPPRLYYLSYGVFCSSILLLVCKRISCKIFKNPLVLFISKHTMWIYLWHILVLDFYKLAHFPDNWILRLIAVYFSSIMIVFIVNKLLDLIEKKKKVSFLQYLRG